MFILALTEMHAKRREPYRKARYLKLEPDERIYQYI